jgi:hypothetical protein
VRFCARVFHSMAFDSLLLLSWVSIYLCNFSALPCGCLVLSSSQQTQAGPLKFTFPVFPRPFPGAYQPSNCRGASRCAGTCPYGIAGGGGGGTGGGGGLQGSGP